MSRHRALALAIATALVAVMVPSANASSTHHAGRTDPVVQIAELPGGSGSTIGPGGDLFVTSGPTGSIFRIDRHSRQVTTFAEGLPKQVLPLGGVMDVAFRGSTAYALVTLVGPDVGGSDPVGLYRIDGPTSATLVADIGTWSESHPPDTEFFVPTGVQYALQPFRRGFLVTDGHHNRVLEVRTDGTISELVAFGNDVPTGLELRGRTVLVALAGPVPHLPRTGRVVAVNASTGQVKGVVARGAPLLVDVERGRGSHLYALSQGTFPPDGEAGSPAYPDTGSLVKVTSHGSFRILVDGLDRPTSLEIQGHTAYVVGLAGDVVAVHLGAHARPHHRHP